MYLAHRLCEEHDLHIINRHHRMCRPQVPPADVLVSSHVHLLIRDVRVVRSAVVWGGNVDETYAPLLSITPLEHVDLGMTAKCYTSLCDKQHEHVSSMCRSVQASMSVYAEQHAARRMHHSTMHLAHAQRAVAVIQHLDVPGGAVNWPLLLMVQARRLLLLLLSLLLLRAVHVSACCTHCAPGMPPHSMLPLQFPST